MAQAVPRCGGPPCATRAITPAPHARCSACYPFDKCEGRDGNDNRRPAALGDRGVDTHLDVNVAAAVDNLGGLLGVAEFATTRTGYGELLAWLNGFGPVARVGVEGTSSYGAGLARSLRRAGVEVLEVDRPNRQ